MPSKTPSNKPKPGSSTGAEQKKAATIEKPAKGNKPNALQQPLKPSEELAAVVGKGELARGEQRRDLLELMEDRYGRGATLLTSQVPVDRWHDLIGDPTLADAILDRLVHNAHRIQLRGDSLRRKRTARDGARRLT